MMREQVVAHCMDHRGSADAFGPRVRAAPLPSGCAWHPARAAARDAAALFRRTASVSLEGSPRVDLLARRRARQRVRQPHQQRPYIGPKVGKINTSVC